MVGGRTIIVSLKKSPDNVGAAPYSELRLRSALLVVAPDHYEREAIGEGVRALVTSDL